MKRNGKCPLLYDMERVNIYKQIIDYFYSTVIEGNAKQRKNARSKHCHNHHDYNNNNNNKIK